MKEDKGKWVREINEYLKDNTTAETDMQSMGKLWKTKQFSIMSHHTITSLEACHGEINKKII